jgi:hypothetical protein
MLSPYSGLGGSSASHGIIRMNSGIDQFTWISMWKPMMKNHMNPVASETIPNQPR